MSEIKRKSMASEDFLAVTQRAEDELELAEEDVPVLQENRSHGKKVTAAVAEAL